MSKTNENLGGLGVIVNYRRLKSVWVNWDAPYGVKPIFEFDANDDGVMSAEFEADVRERIANNEVVDVHQVEMIRRRDAKRAS